MKKIKYLALLTAVMVFGFGAGNVSAQESPSVLYVPLIGISSVPEPLALPKGPGDVTYHYAVKNFLQETPLTNVEVTDDKCSPANYAEGDDDGDGRLDYSETWRYTCTTKLVQTTQSIATAIGTANDLPAAHKAYTTVIVGSDTVAPLVNIINITKVAYPLTLPIGGGDITFTYRVNNPGVVPLSDVSVTDDKCAAMSSKLGDTNGNGLLDITEVWVYTCSTHLVRTTTNTVSVAASANGLKAVGYATITVTVATVVADPPPQPTPSFPDTGVSFHMKIAVWGILSAILLALIACLILTRKRKTKKSKKESAPPSKLLVIAVVLAAAAGIAAYLLSASRPDQDVVPNGVSGPLAYDAPVDEGFGWKYPVVKFPTLGSGAIAYSDIRDPGGIPQGLPVRLKIPIIGVDSTIEDAYITPDGRMDVPQGSVDVAWFALGPHPGQIGSAVIGGHFGISNGKKFVFYDLDKLKIGDKIYVVNDEGKTLAFVVRAIKLFDRTADATTVFTSDDGLAHLNVITCEGVWNKVNGLYPQRRVVFTDAVPLGEASEAIAAVVHPSLKLGARGADVTALQNALVLEKFLVIPRGVAMGYYGALTRTAVAKYQTSVGLPKSGVFDQATRAKLMPQTGTNSNLPSTGIETVTPTTGSAGGNTPASGGSTSPTSFQAAIQSALSLYATPIEGLLTSVLLFLIAFVLLRIIRRRSPHA